MISWKSSLQGVVALSNTDVEYMDVAEAIKEALWLKGLAEELGFEQRQVVVYCDSQSAIHLTKNTVFHEGTKHIDVRLHFIRHIISKREVTESKIATEVNPADILTKVIPLSKFKEALGLLKIKE